MASDLPLDLQIAILGADMNPVGSGLMIDHAHILTCTHVLRMAANVKDEVAPPPSEVQVLTLPWKGDPPATARLVPGAWKATRVVAGDNGIRDLALLELTAPTGSIRSPWGLYPGANVPKAALTLFAFPEGQPAGVRSDIILKGVVGDSWWQADNTPAAQYKMQPGFSGSPIFEPSIERVLGLLAEADRGAARVGFLIPGSVLLAFLADVAGSDFADRFRAPAPVCGAPELPKKLVQRTSVIQRISGMLLCGNPRVGLVGLRGMGGIGKTVAARLLIDSAAIRRRYHDGIFWCAVGENLKEEQIKDRQRGLLSSLGCHGPPGTSSIEELREAMAKELDGRSASS
jgi:hypothetical protein